MSRPSKRRDGLTEILTDHMLNRHLFPRSVPPVPLGLIWICSHNPFTLCINTEPPTPAFNLSILRLDSKSRRIHRQHAVRWGQEAPIIFLDRFECANSALHFYESNLLTNALKILVCRTELRNLEHSIHNTSKIERHLSQQRIKNPRLSVWNTNTAFFFFFYTFF